MLTDAPASRRRPARANRRAAEQPAAEEMLTPAGSHACVAAWSPSSAGPTSASRPLVNALVGARSRSSRQGRRPRAIASRAWRTTPTGQIVFVDTPGLHTRREARAQPLHEPDRGRRARRRRPGAVRGRGRSAGPTTTHAALDRLRGLPTPGGAGRQQGRPHQGQGPAVAATSPRSAAAPRLRLRGAAVGAASATISKRWAEILQRLPEGPPLYPEDSSTGHDEPSPPPRSCARSSCAACTRSCRTR